MKSSLYVNPGYKVGVEVTRQLTNFHIYNNKCDKYIVICVILSALFEFSFF